jgi:predicted chitinase
MQLITEAQLQHIYKEAPAERIRRFLPLLNETMTEFDINTPARIRMFLAQVGHESGQLRYLKEIASGDAYEKRADLGNSMPGDGPRYKGRGLIQLTGRRNYAIASLALDLPLLDNPELLEEPENACRVSGWYWKNNSLNSFADAGLFKEVTRRINGGYNGYADRYKLYQRALEVL